jgi:segregation and condensation protein A
MLAANKPWTIHTEVFDGPLDLLLYLVKRDSIDLAKLPIAQIADSYLEYLDQMRDLRLNVASEYLVMAATLVHMKSLRLLPRLPTLIEQEDEEDPAAALSRQLLEYQRFKEVAMDLDGRPRLDRDVFSRPSQPVGRADGPIPVDVGVFGLLEIYHGLLSRHEAGPPVHAVNGATLQIDTGCAQVLQWLEAGVGGGDLGGLLQAFSSRSERIVGFIGVLEMVRLGWLSLSQQVFLGPVAIARRPGVVVDFSALTGQVQ